jgi:hypothetical protein
LPERFRGGCSFGDWVYPMLSRFVSDASANEAKVGSCQSQ